MLPFAEKRSTFSSGVRGPTGLCSGSPHAHDLQPARKISMEQNDELRALQGLYTLGAVGIWQLKGGVDAHMSGQFEICHINRGEYYKAPVLDATTASEDIQLGDVELRSTYRRSLYVWIKGVHTITSPVI